MKLTVLQENLIKGLAAVGRSVASRPQLPVLANILLATDEGQLKLSATNLETGVHFWTGAKIEKEGSFTVPARVLSEFAASLPKDKVEMFVEENQLMVKSGEFEASFNGIPASEFPPLPLFPDKPTFSFDAKMFKEAVEKTAFAAATDEGRPVLTGVLLSFSKEGLSFAATDGYRLSVVKMAPPKGDKEKEEDRKILLPARTLMEIARSGGTEEEKEDKKNKKDKKTAIDFALLPSGNQAIFSLDSTQIISQVIGGEYPNYEKIIPASSTSKITVATEDLLRAVKMAAIFARESANIVRFSLAEEKLTVSANTPQVGTNKSVLGVRGKGEGEIAFNSRYLLDFLNVAGSGEVVFETSGALSPGVFRIAGDENYLHIIMPVRVQS